MVRVKRKVNGILCSLCITILLIPLAFSLHASATEAVILDHNGLDISYYGNTDEPVTWLIEYENEVQRFLNPVDDSWSDEEKLIYLHDYVVRRSNYTYGTEGNAASAYSVLIKREGICSGYTKAFMDIALRMGIHTDLWNATMHSIW